MGLVGEVALAIHEIQEPAMMGTLISMDARPCYYSKSLGVDYQPLYICWRDYAIEQRSLWAMERKEQDDVPQGVKLY